MAYFVPPGLRKEREDDAVLEENSEAYQREMWTALVSTLTGIVNRVTADTVEDSATDLFRENIVRGRGLLAQRLMRTQRVDPELSPVLASLAARVNKELPDVINLLCRRLIIQWTRAKLRRDWQALACVSRFLCWLYIFQVIDVGVIYQMILAHLTSEKQSDEDIDQAARVFQETFKCMSQRSRAEFHTQVLTPFRNLLAMDDDDLRLSQRSQAVLESCLKKVQQWEKVKTEEAVIPPRLVLFPLSEQTTHELDLEEKYDAEDHLDRFSFDKDFAQHEEEYETVRRAILGDDWETELLQRVVEAEDDADDDGADEDSDEGGDGGQRGGDAPQSQVAKNTSAAVAVERAALDASKKVTDKAEIELREAIYMVIRSSVRADEAAHRILKLPDRLRNGAEQTICYMLIEDCCQQKSYKNIYSMTAERLCKTNAFYQTLFVECFKQRYLGADDLTEKQIQYTSRFFSHLLRTNSVYWSRCLGVIDIVNNNTSQRIFIENLLRTLTEDMSEAAVAKRFAVDRELRERTTRLFPVDGDERTLRQAINIFEAMRVGYLAAPLRAALEAEPTASRKRKREEEVE